MLQWFNTSFQKKKKVDIMTQASLCVHWNKPEKATYYTG